MIDVTIARRLFRADIGGRACRVIEPATNDDQVVRRDDDDDAEDRIIVLHDGNAWQDADAD